MACTGIEFCKLAIVETKARAHTVIAELERRLPDFDAPISIHVNGCPNSCARIQVADIGLKGMVMTDDDGDRRASRCTSAAASAPAPAGPQDPRGLQGPAEDLPDYVERLGRRYLAQRTDGRAVRRSGPTGPTRRTCDERAPRLCSTARSAPRRTCGRSRSRAARGCAAPAPASSRVDLVSLDTSQIPGRLAEESQLHAGGAS